MKKVVVRLDCVVEMDTTNSQFTEYVRDAFRAGLKVTKRRLKGTQWEATLRVTDANIGYVVEKEG